jgi:hypothetical protein
MTTQEKSDEISSMHFDHSEAADTSAEKGYTDNQLLPDGLHRDFFESLPIFASLFVRRPTALLGPTDNHAGHHILVPCSLCGTFAGLDRSACA